MRPRWCPQFLEQHRTISFRDIGVRPEVDHNPIHAHQPDPRAPPTAQQHRHTAAQRTRAPVRVPHGQQSDRTVPLCHPTEVGMDRIETQVTAAPARGERSQLTATWSLAAVPCRATAITRPTH